MWVRTRLEACLTDLRLFLALDDDQTKWELTGYWHPLRRRGRDMGECYAAAHARWCSGPLIADAPYVPGWDCHGLPIEHKVDMELGDRKKSMSRVEIRRHCRAYAERFIKIQREEFKRLGVSGEWDNPYLTMNYPYEAAIAREFGRFALNGSLVRAKKT